MKVVQVGSVAGSAQLLEQVMPEVVSVPFRQAGARSRVKIAAAPLRVAEALRVARIVRRARPDVVHVHWVPNGIVGPLIGAPWVLHAHGSDVRAGKRRKLYRPLLRMADALLCSTPDLVPLTGAEHLPMPMEFRERGAGDEWDVGIACTPIPVKGTVVAEAAVAGRDRMWRTTTPIPREDFIERMARTRVIVGQLVLGVIGNVALEAMSVGRPVIAYVDPRWYPEPPPVLNARTVEDVRTHVGRMLADPEEADRVGRAGQAWVRRYHDPAAVREQLAGVYARIT